MKTCSTCKLEKSLDDFASKGTGKQSVCKLCQKEYRRNHYLENRQKYIDKAKAYTAANGGKVWEMYKLDPESFEALKSKYDGLCWACKEEPGYCVDHDHSCCPGSRSCGKCVRGWLCRGCNSGLGYFRDSRSRLESAIQYLNNSGVG